MQFNSLTFLGFFALVLAVHSLPIAWRAKKLNLVVASYLFYAAWNPPFVLLLWLSTLTDWWVAGWIDRARTLRSRRALLAVSLGVNLGLLGYFKYGGFLLEVFVEVSHSLGFAFEPAAPSILLPAGISFYTFQSLSYTLDVYQRKMKPWRSALDFTLFVTFFPQLVAGPIVRAATFLPQCLTPRAASRSELGWGMTLILAGLFQKTVVADTLLDPMVRAVYDQAGAPDIWLAWCATVAFAGQIFSDFSGYSLCAIGSALCLGFRLPDNFHFPYAAIGFSDFWRRWHISLSTWLRDYLYIPLGGNRSGRFRTGRNLMITMLLGGLWHGAAWTFVAWGAIHGSLLLIERGLRVAFSGSTFWTRPAARSALAAMTFALVCIAWVFFRASTFDRALLIVLSMLGGTSSDTPLAVDPTLQIVAAGTMGCMLLVHGSMRNRTLSEIARAVPWRLSAAAMAAMLVAIVAATGEDRGFIYFQF